MPALQKRAAMMPQPIVHVERDAGASAVAGDVFEDVRVLIHLAWCDRDDPSELGKCCRIGNAVVLRNGHRPVACDGIWRIIGTGRIGGRCSNRIVHVPPGKGGQLCRGKRRIVRQSVPRPQVSEDYACAQTHVDHYSAKMLQSRSVTCIKAKSRRDSLPGLGSQWTSFQVYHPCVYLSRPPVCMQQS